MLHEARVLSTQSRCGVPPLERIAAIYLDGSPCILTSFQRLRSASLAFEVALLKRIPFISLLYLSQVSVVMDAPGDDRTQDLTWGNVGLAFSFILFDAVVSKIFGLGIGTSLMTAAVRCVVQLTLVALILQKVFDTNNPWGVAGIACAYCLLHRFDALITCCFLISL